MEFSIFPFLVVLAISLAIGFFVSRSNKKTEGYYHGNRSLGWFLLMMTFVATQVGGGFILGTAEAAYESGIYGIFYSLGQALGFLALGLGFGARLQSLGLNTASDLFETYYGSKTLKKYAALLSIIALTGILIAQAVALKKFLFALGFDTSWLFYLCWFAVIFYTTQGGFLAVVWTDLLQASVMITILIVAFFFTLSHPTVESVTFTPTNDPEWPKLTGLLVMPFLFMFIEQDMVQRCFAGKSRRDVTVGALLAAAILFALAFIPTYFGMLGKELGANNDLSSKFMQTIFLATNSPIASAAACGVLLAIVATSSSLLSAISSNIANDFNLPSTKSAMRICTASVGLIALLASNFSTNIFTWMIASYELAVDCLFVSLVMAVFYKERCNKLSISAYLATIFGSIGFVETKFVSHDILGVFLPLLLSFAGYALGLLFQRKETDVTESRIPVN
jgi:SSS family solute:Na+ symporter